MFMRKHLSSLYLFLGVLPALLLLSPGVSASTCAPSGKTPLQDASQLMYTGAPDAWGGDVSLWGAGSGIGNFDDYADYGDYVMYQGLDFGGGKSAVEVNLANGNQYTQTLELWIDGLPGSGQKIGQVSVPPTGGWGSYVTYTGAVNVCDVHDLYLVPVTTNWEALGNVMWFRFSGDPTPPAPEYALTVTDGSGDGLYAEGAEVTVTADPAPAGEVFSTWNGDVAYLADAGAATTTLTMPAAAIDITAGYAPVPPSTCEPSGQRARKDAFDLIYAGAPTRSGGDVSLWGEGSGIGGFDDYSDYGDFVMYRGLDFGDGATQMEVNVANGNSHPQTLELWIDGKPTRRGKPPADGRKIGEVTVQPTGGWGNYVTYTGAVDVCGVHKLFLIPVTTHWEALGNVMWFRFVRGAPSPQYALTVHNGSGDGHYNAGVQVTVHADAAPDGQRFLQWTGDTGGLADVDSSTTTLTMPAAATTVTANYEDLPPPTSYTLTVHNGGGDGSYAQGTQVTITADAAPGGQRFAHWAGDVSIIADIHAAITTLTMPAAAATVTAVYEPLPPATYSLTVNGGSGDGNYSAGTLVNISADGPPNGQRFARWIGDVGGVGDVHSADTTLTMPSTDVDVTATYEDIPATTYTLTVHNGSGDGAYAEGAQVAITADAPSAGQAFDHWSGDTTYVTDAYAAATTLTMPAGNVSLTAHYVQAQYTLTVHNGSGDGNYAQGAVVAIVADPAPVGQHFKQWTGDNLNAVADVYAAATDLTMPQSATTVTATYELDTPADCVATGRTPQLSAFDQQYAGDPSQHGGDISLWGPGSGLGNFDDYALYGDWVMYAGVDFGTGANEVTLNVAVDAPDPQTIELWVDGLPNSGGVKIGQVTIQPTGSWSVSADHAGVVDVCSVHDLYLIPVTSSPWTGVGNLMWFSFKNTLSNLSPSAALSATPASGSAPLVVEFDASASTDPEGHTLSARWDFDYDGADFRMQQDHGAYLNTQSVFYKPGTYTAAVEIRDPSDAADIETVTITVNGVDAGDKQSALTGHDAALQGAVSPASGVTWSYVSGPGPVVFANPNALNTSVSFPAGPGHYLLKLTAHALGDSDTVQVEVVDETPIIPIARRVDWSRAGVEGGIPDAVPVSVQLTAQDLAANPVGVIQNAIDSATAPGAVLLPEGVFHLNGSAGSLITLRDGIVLRGRGMDKTRLVINAPGLFHHGAIRIAGSADATEYAVAAGYVEGSQRLRMSYTGDLAVGDSIWLYQDNDPVLMSTDRSDPGVGWNPLWAANVMGQIVRITHIDADGVEIDAPLRRSYSSTKNTRLRRLNMIRNVGVEDLAIERQNDNAEDFNILMHYAENAWVRNVEFAYTKRAHVWMNYSRFVTLESNYGHDSWAYGSGGYGYGFVAAQAVSDSLIWNNILQRQSAAIMVKQGANGVVAAYNTLLDRWNPVATTDVSVHGHYTYANLIEGNVMDSGRATDWWGPAGNYITFFRNRVSALNGHSSRLGISVADRTHYVNIAGNTFLNGDHIAVENDGLHNCYFTLREGNRFNGALAWNEVAPQAIPASRFLHQAPPFWGATAWPAVGADVDGQGLTPIPSEAWHQRIQANGSPVPFD